MDDADYRRFIGQRLAEARKDAGMTQPEAAEKLTKMGFRGRKGDPVGPSSIGNWEQGIRFPKNLKIIPALCQIYGCYPSKVYGFDEAPQDERQAKLNKIYALSDPRGKDGIFRFAESQSPYLTGREQPEKTGSSD